MNRKRPPPFVVDLSNTQSEDPDYDGYDDVQCSQLPNIGSDSYCPLTDSDHSSHSSPSTDETDGFNKALFQLVMKDLIKKLKRELSMTTQHRAKRSKHNTNQEDEFKDGFTRFSATAFASVVNALSPERRAIIHGYGFGSLLMFQKCPVPKKFATWLARHVDPKSGDIILDGKVISLTRESVNLAVDLPMGTKPFPTDPTTGKDIVLSKFNKESLPQVTYFAKKLINNDVMSDEDVFVCFIVVALSSFLCPNSSLFPSPKYFGIFEDITNAKDYDWCGYVLQWLLDAIKAFNRGRHGASKPRQSLGGCLYYLAVVYLDHIDFRHHQVSDAIPRISVWKNEMIKFYSDLDMKSPGIYGRRPIMDFQHTCYAKFALLKHVDPTLAMDSEFCEQMEQVSGCKLPSNLKTTILKLINNHCFNSGVSVNMDLISLANIPDELKQMFCKLVDHAYRIDSRTRDLVLQLMKAIAEGAPSEDVDRSQSTQHRTQSDTPSFSFHNGTAQKGTSPNVPAATKSHSHIKEVGEIMTKLVKDVPQPSLGKKFDCPSSSYPSDCGTAAMYQRMNNKSVISTRSPLADISNTHRQGGQASNVSNSSGARENDAILIGNDFVPDSVSPSPLRHRRLFNASKDDCPRSSSMLSKKCSIFSAVRDSTSSKNVPSPEVQVLGSRSLADNVKDMVRETEALYNANHDNFRPSIQTPHPAIQRIHCYPSVYSLDPEDTEKLSEFKVRNSSTGGKVPHHGPRRGIVPSRFLADEFVTKTNKYHVTTSQIDNYNAICSLASSRSSSEDAIMFGGVRCTFWSLGESLKPGGFVNNFVIAAFYYHLFCKPNGHPDVSKRHYFFSNIFENLLKDPHEANEEVLMKAFRRSAKNRPLAQSDLLLFPTIYKNHWFVFIVDIKDSKFVFLDSYYQKDDDFHVYVREQMITSFQFWWDKYVGVDKDFEEYAILYPRVPRQSKENEVDSGVYVMMFLQYWNSPRTILVNLFEESDIQNITIRIANELLFSQRNSGRKDLVITFDNKENGNA